MSYNECVAGVCTAHVFLVHERRRRRNLRRWWTRHFLNKDTRYGENLLADFKLEDGAGFRNFVKMTPSDFYILLQISGSRISGTETKSLAAIPPSIRSVVTLRYLATGESY
jgi:hypothetical protein